MRNLKVKIIIISALLLTAISVMIIASTKSSAQYYLTVDELLAQKQILSGRNVRISGNVVDRSIKYDTDIQRLSFQVVSSVKPEDRKMTEEKVIHVIYHGVKPDLLNDGVQVVISGQLQADNIFQADELLLKCPSKYEE